jgi:protease IV
MNIFYLYRQIFKGTWFIHHSYALTLAPLLNNLLNGKNVEMSRDWDKMPTMDLDKMDGRAALPVQYGAPGRLTKSLDSVPPGSVAVIPLKSVMVKYGSWCDYGTEEIAAELIKAGSNQNIDAIVLDIDSGGGSVDAVSPMIDAINKVRTEFKKPVVAVADMCASAAYYVACFCDRIIAGNNISSEFGSIGVMVSFADMKPVYEKMGVVFHTIYAPESTHKNQPFENALKSDYTLIQNELLSPLAQAFQNAVKTNRGEKLNMKTEGLLNGRMFFAADAKSSGLIDEVANIDYAINLALSLREAYKLVSNEL